MSYTENSPLFLLISIGLTSSLIANQESKSELNMLVLVLSISWVGVSVYVELTGESNIVQ